MRLFTLVLVFLVVAGVGVFVGMNLRQDIYPTTTPERVFVAKENKLGSILSGTTASSSGQILSHSPLPSQLPQGMCDGWRKDFIQGKAPSSTTYSGVYDFVYNASFGAAKDILDRREGTGATFLNYQKMFTAIRSGNPTDCDALSGESTHYTNKKFIAIICRLVKEKSLSSYQSAYDRGDIEKYDYIVGQEWLGGTKGCSSLSGSEAEDCKNSVRYIRFVSSTDEKPQDYDFVGIPTEASMYLYQKAKGGEALRQKVIQEASAVCLRTFEEKWGKK